MTVDMARERVMHVLIERQAAKYGERVFLYFGNRQFGFATVNREADRVASGLQRLGISKGDKVAVVMDNCPEVVFTVFGLSKLGGVAVPINTAHKGDLLAHMLDQSDSRMLVMHRHYIDRLGPVLGKTPKIQFVVVQDRTVDPSRGGDTRAPDVGERITKLGKGMMEWSDLVDNEGSYQPAEVFWSDPLFIMYTSGTTGVSKGVLLPHNLMLGTVERYCDGVFGLGEEDCIYNFMPLFHVGGWHIGGVNLALMSGARMVLVDRFSASKFWEDIRGYGCTHTTIAGGIPSILFAAEPRSDDADNPLRVLIGGPVPKEIYEDFETRFGVRFVELYGMTEIGSPVMSELGNRKPASCGRVHRDYAVKIVDDEGAEVGPNTPGELLVRALKPHSTMLEYYKMPEQTVNAWRDLWFHSGDYLCYDEDGYFYFVDRKKDALRRRGENISSFEVEKVINSHPAVLESAALPAKSELGEDELMVCLTLKQGESLSPEELIAYSENLMAYFMVPRYIRFMNALPKTPTLRVEKYRLRDEGITSDTWDREKVGYKLRR